MGVIATIDPGVGGAVGLLGPSGQWVVHDCPCDEVVINKKKKQIPNPTLMGQLLTVRGLTHVYIERAHPMPSQGVTSSFNYGMGYGFWLAIIAMLGVSHTKITSGVWSKVMLVGKDTSTLTLRKHASRARALELFPYLAESIRLAKHHGRSDAVLIGEYGMRQDKQRSSL